MVYPQLGEFLLKETYFLSRNLLIWGPYVFFSLYNVPKE
jgi:hypothetical protein